MTQSVSKISVTIPIELTTFISYYSTTHNNMNRSAIIKKALELLRKKELEEAYKKANSEIDHDFDSCAGDGL